MRTIHESVREVASMRKGTDHRVIAPIIRRRILLTGGCGFIASNYVNHHLRNYEYDFILNLDRLDPCSNIKNIEPWDKSRYKFVKGDLQNQEFIQFLLEEYNIDHVMHFAA